eukprot:COSAG04_NODE_12791_length_635_cov_0.861940_1_plen_155_part_00
MTRRRATLLVALNLLTAMTPTSAGGFILLEWYSYSTDQCPGDQGGFFFPFSWDDAISCPADISPGIRYNDLLDEPVNDLCCPAGQTYKDGEGCTSADVGYAGGEETCADGAICFFFLLCLCYSGCYGAWFWWNCVLLGVLVRTFTWFEVSLGMG